jgi:hypothetical protein
VGLELLGLRFLCLRAYVRLLTIKVVVVMIPVQSSGTPLFANLPRVYEAICRGHGGFKFLGLRPFSSCWRPSGPSFGCSQSGRHLDVVSLIQHVKMV